MPPLDAACRSDVDDGAKKGLDLETNKDRLDCIAAFGHYPLLDFAGNAIHELGGKDA